MGAGVNVADAGGLVVNSSIVRKDEYSYLVESKTALFVSSPRPGMNRSFQAFFAGFSLAIAIGVGLDNGKLAWIAPLLFVSVFSAYHFIRSFSAESVSRSQILYVGAGENPIELFRSSDRAEFAAKRLEFEQSLMTKPV